MAIEKIKIEDTNVFGGKIELDYCTGVNILIGGNGTGKTTMLRYLLFGIKNTLNPKGTFENPLYQSAVVYKGYNTGIGVYIPEKDILEHALGLLPFIEQKQTGFGEIYRSVLLAAQDVPTRESSELLAAQDVPTQESSELLAAQDVPTREQSDTQKYVVGKLSEIIGGHVHRESADGSFYTLKTDGRRVPFSMEASGFKRLGFLQLLVSFGLLNPGAVLFWDEPENSLNPEIIPDLVDILLRLSRSGVQIFLATHNELFANYFSVVREKDDKVSFISLYKDGGQVKANTSDRFDLLVPNELSVAPVKLYEIEIERSCCSAGIDCAN